VHGPANQGMKAPSRTSPHSSPPARAARPRRTPWLLPVLVSLALAVWQFSFNLSAPERLRAYAMKASQGLCADIFYFFYFYHHFGVFPVGALEVPQLGPSKREAMAFVADHGDRLRMDFGLPTNTPRFGDYGKLLLFIPDVVLRGDPAHPSAIPFNEFLFIASLVALFWAFRLEGQARLGMFVVLLVGSDPFQIAETYGRGNVFSLPISVALLVLAGHLRFLTGRKAVDAVAWPIAVASGAMLATIREVRAEAAFIGVSAFASYLLIRSAPLGRRVLLAVAFVGGFGVTSALWSHHWAHAYDRALRLVTQAGGEVFAHRPAQHHAFWHAIFCGLGDYGSDRGFDWDDRVAFRWATTADPVTNPHPIPYHYVSGYYLEETYDGVHHIAPTDLPEYSALVRDRVLREIGSHPLWYAGILWQRLIAIMRDATPARLAIGTRGLSLSGVGWLTIPMLVLLCWQRMFTQTKIIAFTMPLSALPLFVYSGKGTTYYGVAHLVALAIAVDWLVGFVQARRRPHVR
jgi:hypothetical protein